MPDHKLVLFLIQFRPHHQQASKRRYIDADADQLSPIGTSHPRLAPQRNGFRGYIDSVNLALYIRATRMYLLYGTFVLLMVQYCLII